MNIDILSYEQIEFKTVSNVIRREFMGKKFFVEYEEVNGSIDNCEFSTIKQARDFIYQHNKLTAIVV